MCSAITRTLTKIDKFHIPIELTITVDDDSGTFNTALSTKYDFSRADFVSLNFYLNDINWDSVFAASDIDKCVSYLYELFNVGYLFYVPVVSK